jgi:PAS domain S-box-containing protein
MGSEDKWELLEAAPDAVLLARRDGSIVFANRQAEKLFGYTRQELTGLMVETLVPKRFRGQHSFRRESYFAQPNVRPMGKAYELFGLHKDGREVPVDIALSPVPTDNGLLVAASIRDISDLKRLHDAVQESADFNLAILASIRDNIAVLNREGRVTAVNKAWTQFAQDNGTDSAAATGEGVNYLQVCKDPAKQGDTTAHEALDGIQSVLDGTTETFTFEYRCDSAAEKRWFLMTVVPLHRPEGGAVVSHTNITDRKLAELGLRDALEEVQTLRDRLEHENIYLQEELKTVHDFEEIIGHSNALKPILHKIEQVAPTDANVLIQGETGTGKELIARAIHNRSRRKDRPLVKINCAALPTGLIESALFGHEKGAFTGALERKIGRFELADGGTLFLDEIGELEPELQTKLLRVLQEGEFERIGSVTTLSVDVRVIAATNRDLQTAIGEQRFRSDLYYRLAVFPVEVPPLRARGDDIELLVWHFIAKKQAKIGKRIEEVSRSTMGRLAEYDWPGNVRELENVIERAMILSPGPTLMVDDLLPHPDHPRPRQAESRSMADAERRHILHVLEQCNWVIKGKGNAADRLGLKPSTLHSRMNRLGIRRPD